MSNILNIAPHPTHIPGVIHEPRQEPAHMKVYTPTLVLGLGGTGARVLRYLKRYGQEAKGTQNGDASSLGQIRLLAIDTDRNENANFRNLPKLDPNELVTLQTEPALTALRRAELKERSERHILDFLPTDKPGLHARVRAKIQDGVGAGQFRRAGRLFFIGNVNAGANIEQRLKTIEAQLRDQATAKEIANRGITMAQGAIVFVVCSIAGGTGAGTLTDCVALLRKIFSKPEDRIVIIGLLPGPLLDAELMKDEAQKRQTRGNALGVMRELSAFQRHHLGDFSFKFGEDKTKHMELTTGVNFVNAIYLVDHHVGGRQAESWLGLCGAIGAFLHALTASGIGLSQQSQEVNSGCVEDDPNSKHDPLFSALGVGVLEYPIQHLKDYGELFLACKWIEQWLACADKEVVTRSVQETVGLLRAADSRTFCAQFTHYPPESDGFGARKRKELVGITSTDSAFFAEAKAKLPALERILEEPSFRNDCVGKSREITQKGVEEFATKLTQLYPDCLENTLAYFECLMPKLNKLQEKLIYEHEDRLEEEKKLRTEQERLTVLILKRNFGFDRKERLQYLDNLEALLRLRVEASVQPHQISALAELKAKVTTIVSDLSRLKSDLLIKAQAFQVMIENLRRQDGGSIFIQNAFPYTEFASWVEQEVGIPHIALLSDQLTSEAVLNQLHEAICEPLHAKIGSLDLKRDIALKPSLQNKVRTLNTMASPIMQLISSAKLFNDMNPKAFVAGAFPDTKEAEDKKFREEHFTGFLSLPAGIDTGNKSSLTCLQVASGFGAGDWAGFMDAYQHYRKSEWEYHTLSEHDLNRLPPLVRRSGSSEDDATLFGLGLMLECVENKGSNFYQNLKPIPPGKDAPPLSYVAFQKQRGEAAAMIIGAGLVAEANRGALVPGEKLGNSLATAFKFFSEPEQEELRKVIHDLFEQFTRHVGSAEAQRIVGNYVDGPLAVAFGKAKDANLRELWEKLINALKDKANARV